MLIASIAVYEIIIREYTVQVLYTYLNITGGIGIFLILVQYIWGIMTVHRIKLITSINFNNFTICFRMILNIGWSMYLIFHYLAEPLVWIPFLLQGCLLAILLVICLYYMKYTHKYEAYRYKIFYEQYV